jgi:predicted nucleotide-binding protein (sugar kinase/HSP70/actin superfamily)
MEPFLTTKKFTVEDRKRTILAPYFTDYISPLVPPVLKLAGYNVEVLPESNNDSAECGLMYANNEVCYPATLVVGDLIKALKSGKYDVSQTAVIITQTGGQCRASNYIALIRKGIIEAGYPEVPVVSLAMGDSMMNEQPGFTINWMKIMPIALAAILFSDCIAKFYHASAVREKNKGEARRLRQHYLDEAGKLILANKAGALYKLVETAAKHFNEIIIPADNLPKVGLVGEIYLKFNGFANKNVAEWLIERKIEVMPPLLTGFFTQVFVNRKENLRTHIEKGGMPEFVYDLFYKLVQKKIEKVNRLASNFRYFTPIANIFEEAEHGKEIVTLSAQFGEGWLLPAEIVSFAKGGTNNVISLQPFGCIANHIVSKGVEKKIKTLYPQMNLLSLDYDSGVSEVNIINRLLLLTNSLK